MRLRRILVTVILLVVLAGVGYALFLPGLSVARQEPSRLEVKVATWLLHASVPAAAKSAFNPLGKNPDPAAIRAGHDLFTKKCETCHAYDGGGKTEVGGGNFPRPPILHALIPSMTDGEIFYHIRNGIRNTAMPAWNFPDRQVWQLVAYIRAIPVIADTTGQPLAARQAAAVQDAHFVSSQACAGCHQEIYARWSKTRMAN